MKSNRLAILLVVMAILAVVRLSVPNSPASVVLVEPIARAVKGGVANDAGNISNGMAAVSIVTATAAIPSSNTIAAEDDSPGNAFAVPVVVVLPAAQPAPPMVAIAAPAMLSPQPVVALPPPLPPFQVIGTYDDGGEKAVFLATPNSTVIVRAGALPMPDWKVTGITAQHVSLSQLSTQRNVQLPMPTAP